MISRRGQDAFFAPRDSYWGGGKEAVNVYEKSTTLQAVYFS